MKTIVFYVSGHGFGHSVRIQEVMKALHRPDPGIRFLVKTAAPRWLYDGNLDFPFDFERLETDTGVVQKDSLHLDREATLRLCADFMSDSRSFIERETALLSETGCDLVVSDIPPLAFEIASAIPVPSIGIGNFSWDWIYEDFARDYPAYGHLADEMRKAYAKATLLLRLPFFGDLSAFNTIRDIPLIARVSHAEPSHTRERLGLPPGKKIILLSFGGFDMVRMDDGGMRALPDCFFISFAPLPSRLSNALTVPRESFPHEDLVKLSDAVITKPGYGIVSECIANRTPVLYTSRGRFPEYEKLVEGLEKYAVSRFIPQEDFIGGKWKPYLETLLDGSREWVDIDLEGARIAAEHLASFLVDRPS